MPQGGFHPTSPSLAVNREAMCLSKAPRWLHQTSPLLRPKPKSDVPNVWIPSNCSIAEASNRKRCAFFQEPKRGFHPTLPSPRPNRQAMCPNVDSIQLLHRRGRQPKGDKPFQGPTDSINISIAETGNQNAMSLFKAPRWIPSNLAIVEGEPKSYVPKRGFHPTTPSPRPTTER